MYVGSHRSLSKANLFDFCRDLKTNLRDVVKNIETLNRSKFYRDIFDTPNII